MDPAFWCGPVKARTGLDSTHPGAMGFQLCVGADRYSAGAALRSWRYSGGEWPSLRLMRSWRWQDHVLTEAEAVQVAYRALAAYAAEQGIELS